MQAATPRKTSATTVVRGVGSHGGPNPRKQAPTTSDHRERTSLFNRQSAIDNRQSEMYLVIDQSGNGHLPVRDFADGPLNHRLMGAAWAALHSGFRGKKYEGPDKQKAIEKLKALYQSEGLDLPEQVPSSEFRVKSSSNSKLITHNSELPRFVIALSDTGAGTVRIPLAITGQLGARGQPIRDHAG